MEEQKLPARRLAGKGEWDYDYVNDILFFKIKDREYVRSIQMDRFAVDVDVENFIVGIQIFDASEFLRTPKIALKNVGQWRFTAAVDDNRLEVRIDFVAIVRNKKIRQQPIIVEPLKEDLPDSEVELIEAR